MSLTRSQSAPHIKIPDQTFPRGHRADVQRHASAITLGSSKPTSVYGYGYHTPREERDEDPFSLAGFFPSTLALSQNWRSSAWSWLRGSEDDNMEESMIPGSMSPVSEDEEWIPPTPGSVFEEEDTVMQATIKQEDKLGVLSFDDLFGFSEAGDASGPLLSPYTKDDPVDSDALHDALCALRKAHTTVVASTSDKEVTSDGLFSPVEDDGEDKLEELELETHVNQNLRRFLDVLPL